MFYCKFTLKNLIKFSCIFFILTFLILFLYYHFQIPDYYADREIAFQAINNGMSAIEVNKLYRNKEYLFQNGLFHICTFTFILLIVLLVIGNKYVQKVIGLKPYIITIISYIFLNMAYPIWSKFAMNIVEIELKKYVYPANADSIMIPILGTYALLTLSAFLYYPIVNIFNFIVFNTKISSKILIVTYKIIFCILILNILFDILTVYSINFGIIYLIEICYLIVVKISIDKLKSKKCN